jgi:hypothetical protein
MSTGTMLTYGAPVAYNAPPGAAISPLVVADVTGDGNPDVVLAQFDRSLSLFTGNNDGTFAMNAIPVGSGLTGMSKFPVFGSADLNGDHRADVVMASDDDDAIAIFLGGASTLTLGHTYSVGTVHSPTGTGQGGLGIGDFDLDGKLDIVAPNYMDGTVSVLHGNGDGSFSILGTYPGAATPTAIAVADVNGDGKLDVLETSFSGSQLIVLLNVHP